MKRIYSLLCAAVVGLSGMAAAVSPELAVFAEADTSGTCGENLTWKFDAETGTLTIFGEGAMREPEYDGDVLFESLGLDEIHKVVMDYGVTKISQAAFQGCRNLTSVTIPESVESIEWGVFYDCESLTEINIPNSINKISDSAFWNYKSLTAIFIPSSIKMIDYGAFGESGLTAVTIPESVDTIYYWAFFSCANLNKITILNPDCEIYDHVSTISDTAVIVGCDGSTAQAYAEKYGCTFESLGAAPSAEPDPADIDGDGETNIADAVAYARLLTEESDSAASYTMPDLDGDGYITLLDVIKLLRKIAGTA